MAKRTSDSCRYYHPNLGREGAEKLLISFGKDGTYLVKASQKSLGHLTLCLLSNGQVYHYRMISDPKNMWYLESKAQKAVRKHGTVAELLEFYRSLGSNNGLQTALLRGVHNDGGMSSDDDSDGDDNDSSAPSYYGSAGARKQDSAAMYVESLPPVPPKMFDDQLSPTEESLTPHNSPTSIAEILTRKCSQVRHCGLAPSFVGKFESYLKSGLSDDLNDLSPTSHDQQRQRLQLHNLANLLEEEAIILRTAITEHIAKLHFVSSVFASNSDVHSTPPPQHSDRHPDKLSILMGELKATTDALHPSCLRGIEELKDETRLPMSSDSTQLCVTEGFQAIHDSGNNYPKPVTIHLDRTSGLLTILRHDSELTRKSQFKTSQLRSVRRSLTDSTKLELSTTDGQTESYYLHSPQARDELCQLILSMKRKYYSEKPSRLDRLQALTVYCGTWNMGNSAKPPQLVINQWIKCQGLGKTMGRTLERQPHDIYAFGLQEPKMTEQESTSWLEELLSKQFDGHQFEMVKAIALWKVRLVVFARKEITTKISGVRFGSVKTGIANQIGNKGGVAISLHIENTSICFVCCHLAANRERLERRNQNSRDIMRGLSRSLGCRESFGDIEALNQFQHVFWMGDLNYRIDVDDSEVQDMAGNVLAVPNKYLEKDQLLNAINECRAFYGYDEEPIRFPPTYRYYKGSDNGFDYRKPKINYVKINAPSWCDRILWKSYPDLPITNLSYGCAIEVKSSDHKPTFASFALGVPISEMHNSKLPKCSILIQMFDVQCVLTNVMDGRPLDYNLSVVVPGVAKNWNIAFCEDRDRCNSTSERVLVTSIQPIEFRQQTALSQTGHQYAVLSLSCASMGSVIGGAVIPLSAPLSDTSHIFSFNCDLVNYGEKTGHIHGFIQADITGDKLTDADQLVGSYVFSSIPLSQESSSTTSAGHKDPIPNITARPLVQIQRHETRRKTTHDTPNIQMAPEIPAKFNLELQQRLQKKQRPIVTQRRAAAAPVAGKGEELHPKPHQRFVNCPPDPKQ